MTRTFTAGLRLDDLSAPMLLEGPMDGDAILSYNEKVLVPTLTIGDTVIMDNLPAHEFTGVREAIERLVHAWPISHPTLQTSIRSKWHSQNSKP